MTLGTAVILLVLAVAGIVLIFKYLCKVSAKFSCGFSNLLDSSIIVNER